MKYKSTKCLKNYSNFFTLLPIPASIVLNSSSVHYKKGGGEKHINSCDQELCNDNNKLKRIRGEKRVMDQHS